MKGDRDGALCRERKRREEREREGGRGEERGGERNREKERGERKRAEGRERERMSGVLTCKLTQQMSFFLPVQELVWT